MGIINPCSPNHKSMNGWGSNEWFSQIAILEILSDSYDGWKAPILGFR